MEMGKFCSPAPVFATQHLRRSHPSRPQWRGWPTL